MFVIPVFVLIDRLAWVAVAIATAVAARYTSDRAANFDIYLPEWLARHNKLIFGSLYAAGILFALASWRGWLEVS